MSKVRRWHIPKPLKAKIIRITRGKSALRRLERVTILGGARLHLGAGQTLLEGYENLDGYDNEERPEHFKTEVKNFVRAEKLDEHYGPETVAEIRCHHMFEHISILDVHRTLTGWNKVLKKGGLVWIEVPDFEECSKRILKSQNQEQTEILFRHIFGSQFSKGEYHNNGWTASRLIYYLSRYGFKVIVAYSIDVQRVPVPVIFDYPVNLPLPDLTVKAIKISEPDPELEDSKQTNIVYRRHFS